MAARRPPPPATSLVQRKRTGEQQVRKTVYFLPKTAEKLDRYAFEHRLKVWEVVEMAVADFLDHATSRQRTSTPPPPSAPPSTKKRTQLPQKTRTSVVTNDAPPSQGRSSSRVTKPPSTRPSPRQTTRPPRNG